MAENSVKLTRSIEQCTKAIKQVPGLSHSNIDDMILDGLDPLFEENMLQYMGQTRGVYELLGARIRIITAGDVTQTLLSGLDILPFIIALSVVNPEKTIVVSAIASFSKLIINICQRACIVKDPLLWKILFLLDSAKHSAEMMTPEQIAEKIGEPVEVIQHKLQFLELGIKNTLGSNVKLITSSSGNGEKKYRLA